MTHLDPTAVRHIAKLARLRLTDSEVEKLAPQLSSILNYFEKLNEVDTEGIEPTAQVGGLRNRFREDEIRPSPPTDEMLATSPLPIIDDQIETPSAHG
jgi:aspartyl-tRNA(Asn)/glutamyl-tRNA(Gln) amidotransferase subunit C